MNDYETYLKKQGYSLDTIRGHRYHLNRFLSVVQDSEITESFLKSYFQERYYAINQKGYQNLASSRNREIGVLRTYCRYLFRTGQLDTDFSEILEYVRQPRLELPKDILNKSDLKKLFRQPNLDTVYGYRDRMILELTYAAGLRSCELINLMVSDIKVKTREVSLRNRRIPVCWPAFEYVLGYLEHIRPKLVKQTDNGYLVLNCRGLPFRRTGKLSDLMHRYFQCFNKKVTLSSLRHTLAVQLLQRGMCLRHVQELLGHRKMDSTARYLALNLGNLQKEYRKTHPRELD